MTFLNAALLAGLSAIVLPILIHLFSRRRYPLIDFSSLRFLKKLQSQQMRRLRLRQWILLILRVLAIFLIAFAFTRPTLTDQFTLGHLSSGRVSMVIVIDASASMQAKSPQGTSFQRARDAARTIISLMDSGDQAVVILARNEPRFVTSSPSSDRDVLLDYIDDITPWDGFCDLPKSVDAGLKILGTTTEFRRELYVISDFTSPVDLPSIPAGLTTCFIPVDASNQENISVSRVTVASEIFEPGQPVDLEVTIANHGKKSKEDIYYSIFLDGTRVSENVVSLAAGAELTHQHQIQPETAGLMQGIVQVEEVDALQVDNKYYFCFNVPALIKTLLVSDAVSGKPIRYALSSTPSNRDLIQLDTTPSERWDSKPITDYDVLIFSNPSDFSSTQASRLKNFINQGGGLLVLPGPNTNIARINRELFDILNAPRWGEQIGQSSNTESFLTWEELDTNSPLLRGIVREGSQPATPRFYRSLRIQDVRDNIFVRFENGLPFLVESRYGEGRIMLAASSPLGDWSDWAQRGIFAPLMLRTVLRLASNSHDNAIRMTVGEDLVVFTPAVGDISAELTTPENDRLNLPLKNIGQKTAFVQPALEQAGIYRLNMEHDVYLAAVNTPENESILEQIQIADQFKKYLEQGAMITTIEQLRASIEANRFGRELWKSLLFAGFIVLFIESVLSSVWRRNQYQAQDHPTPFSPST